MNRMPPVKGAVLAEFQFFLRVSPVFLSGIILSFAFAALQGNKFNDRFFACHIPLQVKNLAIPASLKDGSSPNPPIKAIIVLEDAGKKPSNGIEPLTASLPWMCSAN